MSRFFIYDYDILDWHSEAIIICLTAYPEIGGIFPQFENTKYSCHSNNSNRANACNVIFLQIQIRSELKL